MAKRVLILEGSPRRNGNSAALCQAFAEGARAAGHEVETLFLQGLKIAPCQACYYCTKHDGQCALHDDMADVLDRMMAADVLVLASPVYFYAVSAQLKTVIDRSVARWLTLTNKEFYYIMTAAEDTDTVMSCTLECLRGFASCLEGSVERGVLEGKGVFEPGAIRELPIMEEARRMGEGV